MATAEQDLATARRWLHEVVNQHDLNAVPEIISDWQTRHDNAELLGDALSRQSDLR
jgi:hypothetical protein